MSSALMWELLRKNHSFLVRRKGPGRVEFTREKGNLTNVHCQKYSGLANTRGLDVQEAPQGVLFSVKSHKRESEGKTKRTWSASEMKKSYRRSHKVIEKVTNSYRPTLKRAALARLSAITLAQKRKAKSSEV